MKHKFIIGALDSNLCNQCKRPEIDHSDRATCESCGNSGNCDILHSNILMCVDCQNKEIDNMNVDELKEALDNRKKLNDLNGTIQSENASLKISTDLFNAKISGINEIKETIDADENVKEKHFALARVLDVRFKHLSELIAGINKQKTDAETEQRAIQTYYHDLSKKIREDQRAQIKLRDLTYQPASPPPGKIKPVMVKKFDAKSIRQAARESGIPEEVLQVFCVAKGMTVEQAVEHAKSKGLGK